MLKNNVFTTGTKILKELRRTAIRAMFAPPYSIPFIAELEEEILMARSVVVSDLSLETKGSRFESGCYVQRSAPCSNLPANV